MRDLSNQVEPNGRQPKLIYVSRHLANLIYHADRIPRLQTHNTVLVCISFKSELTEDVQYQ
jgi:hypothetical protein